MHSYMTCGNINATRADRGLATHTNERWTVCLTLDVNHKVCSVFDNFIKLFSPTFSG